MNLFSELISSENLHLATGLNNNSAECTDFNEVVKKFKCLLRELFEHFDAIAEELIKTILEKHCKEKAKELKSQTEMIDNKLNTLCKQILNNEDACYHYFSYEDYLLSRNRYHNVIYGTNKYL